MENIPKKMFRPILDVFESGDGGFSYKSSHRLILKVVGGLFLVLAASSIAVGIFASQVGALLPSIIFVSAGLVCVVVGFLGSDHAVANIWRSR